MKRSIFFINIACVCTLFATSSYGQLLIASNLNPSEDLSSNQDYKQYYLVGNKLLTNGRTKLADTGHKIATSFVPNTTAYLSSADLSLMQVLYTNKPNPDNPDPLWPFSPYKSQHLNANIYDVGIYTDDGGKVGTLLEKTQVEVFSTWRWYEVWRDRDFDRLPFTEVSFSNTTLLEQDKSYYLALAAASDEIGYMYWWFGNGPGYTLAAQTDIKDPQPLLSDWDLIAPPLETPNPNGYRIFGTAGTAVPEPASYGVLGVLLLGLLVVRRRLSV